MGIDNNYTIQDIRDQPVDKLYDTMASCGSPGYYQMAVEELQRRFLQDIALQTQSLAESSIRVEALANGLNCSVIAMDASVKRLADSSNKMERLTLVITFLTIALLLLTAVQVAMELRDQRKTPADGARTVVTSAAPKAPSSPPAAGAATVAKPSIPATHPSAPR